MLAAWANLGDGELALYIGEFLHVYMHRIDVVGLSHVK